MRPNENWYKDWFADELYLALYEHRTVSEAEHLLDLIERTLVPEKSARILDLACGAGRHSVSLAKRGFANVTGVDLSPTLIAKARTFAQESHVNVTFIESDMRTVSGEYDFIVNLFTSFGYFKTDEENESVIANVVRCLSDGGFFVLDFLNAHYIREHLVPHSTRTLTNGEVVVEDRKIEHGRVNKEILIRSGSVEKEFCESVRLFTRTELGAMIARQGLFEQHLFGDYEGAPFDEERSSRCILFAMKK